MNLSRRGLFKTIGAMFATAMAMRLSPAKRNPFMGLFNPPSDIGRQDREGRMFNVGDTFSLGSPAPPFGPNVKHFTITGIIR